MFHVNQTFDPNIKKNKLIDKSYILLNMNFMIL